MVQQSVMVRSGKFYGGWKHLDVSPSSYHTPDGYTLRTKKVDGVTVWQKRVRTELDLEGKVADVLAALQEAAAGLVDAEVEREHETGSYGASDYDVHYLYGWEAAQDADVTRATKALARTQAAQKAAAKARNEADLARIRKESPELLG